MTRTREYLNVVDFADGFIAGKTNLESFRKFLKKK
jgi:hypothetical protein